MLSIKVVVLVGDESQVELALSQVVGLVPVLQPGQLQLELRQAVPQVDQFERAVGGLLLPHRLQAQCLLVEGQALVQIQDVEIEVVEFDHVHSLLSGRDDRCLFIIISGTSRFFNGKVSKDRQDLCFVPLRGGANRGMIVYILFPGY